MTPEERSLLESTHKLVEENNGLLRRLHRTNRWSLIAKVAYWIVIILIGFGAFYFIQPYFNSVYNLYDQVQGNINTVQNGANSVKNLFK